eukprot:snap_masked-scaffold_62-processed-gene-0.28-mRNA-1 protein AED:0.84 eAED:1.00 QI:0/0/0/0.5/1/1/2/0/330
MASGFFTCDLLDGVSNGGGNFDERPDREHCCRECCIQLDEDRKNICREGCSEAALDDVSVCGNDDRAVCSLGGLKFFLGQLSSNQDGENLRCCLTELEDGVFRRSRTDLFDEGECNNFEFDVPTSFPTDSPTNFPTRSPTTPKPTRSPVIFIPNEENSSTMIIIAGTTIPVLLLGVLIRGRERRMREKSALQQEEDNHKSFPLNNSKYFEDDASSFAPMRFSLPRISLASFGSRISNGRRNNMKEENLERDIVQGITHKKNSVPKQVSKSKTEKPAFLEIFDTVKEDVPKKGGYVDPSIFIPKEAERKPKKKELDETSVSSDITIGYSVI